MKKKELEKFANSVKKEIALYKVDDFSDEQSKRRTMSGLMDAVYFLGCAIDDEKYAYANGFQIFSNELGIKWDLSLEFKDHIRIAVRKEEDEKNI